MTREVDLCQYLPEVIRNVREYQVLCNVESPQVNALWKALEVVFDNGFLESLTEYGCKRWEDILQLNASDTDTLEIRRKNIFSGNKPGLEKDFLCTTLSKPESG